MFRLGEPGSAGSDDNGRPAAVLNTREARQGITSGHVRTVLAASLFLALIVFAVLYVTMIR